MSGPPNYDDMIGEHENQIAALKKKKAEEEEAERLSHLTEEQRLAELLHGGLCHSNHTDQCDWHYYKWTDALDQYNVRQVYLRKAQSLLEVVDFETAQKVLATLFNQ